MHYCYGVKIRVSLSSIFVLTFKPISQLNRLAKGLLTLWFLYMDEYIQCMVYVLILMDSDNVIPVRLYKLCVCFVIMYFEI